MNIAFIPIRCGSKSIPFKNIKNFCGRPLVYWNLLALQESKYIDNIFVATDCYEISSIVRDFEFSKVSVYARDAKNATDESSTESVILEFLSKNNFNDDDLFILSQATSPLTKTYDFDTAIYDLINSTCDSLLTCTRKKEFIWNENGIPINYDYTNRPRRQDFEGVLVENGAFYINKVGGIMKDNNRLSGKIYMYELPHYSLVDIDEKSDWCTAELLMYKYVLNKKVRIVQE